MCSLQLYSVDRYHQNKPNYFRTAFKISLQFDLLVAGIHMEHAESGDSCCHTGTAGKAGTHKNYLAIIRYFSGYVLI
jgi:hypothetical protein